MPHLKRFRSLGVAAALLATPGLAIAQGLEDPILEPIAEGNVTIGLEVVATGLTAPNWGTFAPGDSGRLFVADQDGILHAIDLATGDKSTFLDAGGLLVPLGAAPEIGLDFDERGFIGVAFHPGYQSNGLLYTYTSEPADSGAADFTTQPPGTTANHMSVITEWRVPNPADPAAVVYPPSRRVLMRIDQPQFNHNSGAIVVLPDGTLLFTVGDGGGADDQPDKDNQLFITEIMVGHGDVGNGQNPETILGSVVRIDPAGNSAPNGQYAVPANNPFYVPGAANGGMAGCADGLCDEIYAYGFRNPFRMSVDAKTGLAFLGDVGQNDIEEVDIVVGGGNYGWKIKEGSFLFDDNGAEQTDGPAFPSKDSPGQPLGMIDPVAQYDHDEGVSVIGGFVYRGNGVGQLRGRYVFGEFSKPPFNPFGVVCDGRLFYLDKRVDANADLIRRQVQNNELQNPIRELKFAGGETMAGRCLLGFGEDANGELYVLTNAQAIPFGTSGEVLRIVRK